MTENEAIEWLSNETSPMKIHIAEMDGENPMEYINEAIKVAIKALEEVQAYKNGDCMNECEHYDNCANYIYSKGYNKAIDEFAEQIKLGLDRKFSFNLENKFKLFESIDEIAEQMKGE